MASVKTDIDYLVANHSQKDVAISQYYGARRVLDTSDPLNPVGLQTRLRKIWKVYLQEDEKSA